MESSRVTIIVRSVGERTEGACVQLLQQQAPAARIFVVHEYPFVAAVKKSYQLGLEQQRRWTLCIDADVLLRAGALNHVISVAQLWGDRFYALHGQVVDKFFGGPQAAGFHLYYTKHLGRALVYLEGQPPTNRPETYVMRRMQEQGLKLPIIDYVAGLHDFEQYYRDIFRKALLHARKHVGASSYLKKFWKRSAPQDADFRVMHLGNQRSRRLQLEQYLDARSYEAAFTRFAAEHGIKEKQPLSRAAISSAWIEHQLQTFTAPPEYYTVIKLRKQQLRLPLRALAEHSVFLWREKGVRGLLRWARSRILKAHA